MEIQIQTFNEIFANELGPDPESVKIWKERYSEEYFKFTEQASSFDLSEKKLIKKGIKSVKLLYEIFNIEPIDPKLIVDKLDGTQQNIWGKENILNYLKDIVE
jgi:hypothetical protein